MNDVENPLFNCTICLKDNIPLEDKCCMECNHFFCKGCIDDWFNTGNNTCPLCRRNITYFNHNNENNRIVILRGSNTQNRDIQVRNLTVSNNRVNCYLYTTLFALLNIICLYSDTLFRNDDLSYKYNLCERNNTGIANNLEIMTNQVDNCETYLENTIDTLNAINSMNSIDTIDTIDTMNSIDTNNNEDNVLVTIVRNNFYHKCDIPLSSYNQCFNY